MMMRKQLTACVLAAGQGREPVLAEHPTPNPPQPVVSFRPHARANGVSVSADERFGFVGDAFVALFGDLAPVTTPRLAAPAGTLWRIRRTEGPQGDRPPQPAVLLLYVLQLLTLVAGAAGLAALGLWVARRRRMRMG
jgi:hypothetical protein